MTAEFVRPHVAQIGYRSGELFIEQVPVRTIAEKFGTPFYAYSASAVCQRIEMLRDALHPAEVQICYAMKANNNLSLLRILSGLGCGMDIVSGGELERTLAAGVPAQKIVFSGVGKSEQEIKAAVAAGVGQLNVESTEELELIAKVARNVGRKVPVVLRVNPDVDAATHPKITTGTRHNKFGIPYEAALTVYARASTLPGIDCLGLAVHIGSQITDILPFRKTFERVAELVGRIRAQGNTITRLDLGGGLGVSYDGRSGIDIVTYGAILRETLADCGCELTIEPGRFVVAEAGILVSEVLYNKVQGSEKFTIVDAGMNDLMRPALYDARHPIWPIAEPAAETLAEPCHIVGPVCESSDTFGKYEALPPLVSGDLLALGVAGAYCAVMSSSYNARPLVQEILVEGNRYCLARHRQTVAAMLKLEQAGEWIAA
ncbi:diaminopimelate decarboxylase [Rhizobium sp. ARZ01]|uniref:diaminopimelate decarboxylase n=1 Tax=Rhizobium sp. ARZ01 TaxID=2769313 RepID=UPI001780BD61|nr:diaminopimelate decarboxylase [Rhizobium sp. ARZ01]MBD9372322.1 diaminopimelate decarboxylase [Rhizobium sp. ARZ01]